MATSGETGRQTGRMTGTWTVAQRLSLSLQLTAAVDIEWVWTVIFSVRRIPPIKHIISADVEEEGATHSCKHTHRGCTHFDTHTPKGSIM